MGDRVHFRINYSIIGPLEKRLWRIKNGLQEGILGTEFVLLLYQDVKMQISFPRFFHFRCQTPDTGTWLHAGRDEDNVINVNCHLKNRHSQS